MTRHSDVAPATSLSFVDALHSILLRNSHVVSWLALAAICFWASWPTIGRGFLGDDFAYVARFAALPAAELPRLFVSDWSGGMWGASLHELRPVAAFTFWIDARLWGTDPTGFRITNLVLYVLACGAVASIAARLHGGSRGAGFIAALLFALYPAHAEPLGWVTGRVDLIAGSCVLWGFALALRGLDSERCAVALCGSLFCFAAGLFSKEIGLILPLLVFGWVLMVRPESFRTTRGRLGRLALGYASVLLVYAICRTVAFESTAGGRSFSVFTADFFIRQIDYSGWLVPPALDLVRVHREALVANSGILVPVATLCALVAAGGALGATRRSGARTLSVRQVVYFTVFWYFATIYALSGVSYFSPRHVFLATAGLSVASAIILRAALPHPVIRSVVVILCAIWLGAAFRRETLPWCNAARVSENLLKAVEAAGAVTAADTTLIVDAPRTFQGAWAWSWASPFALRPPYCTVPYARVLESPESYYLPDRWFSDRQPRAMLDGRPATLIWVEPSGVVRSKAIPAAVVSNAMASLDAGGSSPPDSEIAWRRFMSSLKGEPSPAP